MKKDAPAPDVMVAATAHATADKPSQPIAAARVNDLTDVEQAFPDEETVSMDFPKDVTLILDGHKGKVKFRAGPNDAPVTLADHFYLTAHGVTRRGAKGKKDKTAAAPAADKAPKPKRPRAAKAPKAPDTP